MIMNDKAQIDPRLREDDRKKNKDEINVGILAFHGDIEEHEEAIASLGHSSIRLKYLEDLDDLTHLIFPGGESTVISKFLDKTGMGKAIQKRVREKTLQVYGTCAGAILLANEVETQYPVSNLGLIEAKISRNAYGSQIHSFETELDFLPNKQKFDAIFIRAPKILSHSNKAKVVCELSGEPMMLEQENVLISTFHPELIRPAVIHEYFLSK